MLRVLGNVTGLVRGNLDVEVEGNADALVRGNLDAEIEGNAILADQRKSSTSRSR
jgi:hypothetical protein